MFRLKVALRVPLICGLLALNCATAFAQDESKTGTTPTAELLQSVGAMQQQIKELQSAVAELRSESESYRRETEALRRELQSSRNSTPAVPAELPVADDQQPYSSPRPETQTESTQGVSLEEQLRLLNGKVNDQYQTKVESGSRYRVKLSGMILMNLFGNRGTVDSIDVPGLAEPQGPLFGRGSFGATLRQSQIGIDLFGPTWAGAKVSGNLRFDFAGGFPDENNGVSLGLMRLRTGVVRLDWANTSVVAGQDAPFFSPLSPTSLASVSQPLFSYNGNLWTWIPQVRIEHRLPITTKHSLLLQAGILDPLTGEPPEGQFERLPQAGEVSRQPAYATRVAWTAGEGDNAITVGAGGYYSRQDWGFNRFVDGWAAIADWQIPIAHRFELSGEFFRGRSIGGLGAATDHSVLSTDVLNNSLARVQGLDVVGGWAQFKYRATSTLQFNVGYGQDNPFNSELRLFNSVQNLLAPQLGRNQGEMFNFIYRPKSNLFFSTEYRHIDSVRLNRDRLSAEHVNMSVGVLF